MYGLGFVGSTDPSEWTVICSAHSAKYAKEWNDGWGRPATFVLWPHTIGVTILPFTLARIMARIKVCMRQEAYTHRIVCKWTQ